MASKAKQERNRKQKQKAEIIRDAERLYQLHFGSLDESALCCLYWSWCAVSAARMRGVRLVLQAGSAYWRITPETAEVEGKPNFYGYSWKGPQPIEGQPLPEVHVWVANPQKQILIDMTARFQKDNAEASGLQWKTPAPPDVIWGKPEQLAKQGYLYLPHKEAILFAQTLLKRFASRGESDGPA